MFFKQVKGKYNDNFSYILADEKSKETMVVDPSYNNAEIYHIMDSQDLKLKYIVNTHSHRDHIIGNDDLKARYGGKIVANHLSHISKDLEVGEGDILEVGSIKIKVIYTPGHSSDSICLLADDKILTGDTLFVGECGRTDLSGGDPHQMYYSLFGKLMALNDDLEVYPGHDYGSKYKSTIGHERRFNYTLEKRTVEEFIEFMQAS